MLRRDFHKRRIDFFAAIDRDGAARMEAAARGDVERIGRFALQDDALAAFARIGHGHHGEQRFGVGMLRIVQHVAASHPISTMRPRYITAMRSAK